MPETEIAVRGLTKSFGPQVVLEDITCDIPKGKITLMLGPSGTGKSVFLKHLMGLLRPDRGEIWIHFTMTVPMASGGHQEFLVGEQSKVVEAAWALMQRQHQAIRDAAESLIA